MTSPQIVLGIGYSTHDMSCCLMIDGRVAAAIARERLTRIKHDGGWTERGETNSWDPSICVRYCLDTAGISLDDVTLIVENHVGSPAVDDFHADVVSQFACPYPAERSVMISHHLAHAYSAYYASGYGDAAVLVVDGIGNSRSALSSYEGEDAAHVRSMRADGQWAPNAAEVLSAYSVRAGKFDVVRKDFGTRSIGFAYREVTAMLFGQIREAGKTMGLAPYGRPGHCAVDLLDSCNGAIEYGYYDSLKRAEWPPHVTRWPGEPQQWGDARRQLADLAWKMQHDLEKTLIDVARSVRQATGQRRLCLAGGVALNSAANKRILDEAGFDEVFIVPAAGDDGISLGCASWGTYHWLKRPGPSPGLRHMALGRQYSTASVDQAVASDRRLVATRLSEPELLDAAVDALANGHIIGWFHGGCELGPRALGHRSILASPLDPDMKARLNSRVKFREPFRPFAPVVPLENMREFFDLTTPSPHMLLVAPVLEDKRAVIPAVTHVDGTARVQSVTEADNGLFYRLVKAFGRRTGVPVLLNTSLNVRGEPIVETPEEAVDCFLRADFDALSIDGCWVTKQQLTDRELLCSSIALHAKSAVTVSFFGRDGALRLEQLSWQLSTNTELSASLPSWLAHLLLRVDGRRTGQQVIDETCAVTRMTPDVVLMGLKTALAANLLRIPAVQDAAVRTTPAFDVLAAAAT